MLDTLIDIANNIQIEPNFCIRHPNYEPFALPERVATRFQQNSEELQHKYLTLLLRNFLYGIYYNGSLQTILTVNVNGSIYPQHQNLENYSILGIDWQFYEKLDASNHSLGYFDSGWQVLRREPDGSVLVTKRGLTLYVESEQHLKGSASPSELVDIWMPKNRLSNGFYVAVSNVPQKMSSPDSDLGLGRIYFNFTADGAIAMMDSLTQHLNTVSIPFNFQVLYNPYAYGRYDSGILYFESGDYPVVREVLQNVYPQHQSHFHHEVPLFTKFLAPGLSLAEEPTQKFAAKESFGMNRCQILANALLDAWEKGSNSAEQRMQSIRQHFTNLGIDLQRPYLNPTSEDIYAPLN